MIFGSIPVLVMLPKNGLSFESTIRTPNSSRLNTLSTGGTTLANWSNRPPAMITYLAVTICGLVSLEEENRRLVLDPPVASGKASISTSVLSKRFLREANSEISLVRRAELALLEEVLGILRLTHTNLSNDSGKVWSLLHNLPVGKCWCEWDCGQGTLDNSARNCQASPLFGHTILALSYLD